MLKICFLKLFARWRVPFLLRCNLLLFKQLASILLLLIKKNSFPLQYFSSLLLVLTISSSLFISRLATIPEKPNFILPSVSISFTAATANIWFLTDSWLNIFYDVFCCSTWVCFYLYLVILRNSRISYVFQHGITDYTNMSP